MKHNPTQNEIARQRLAVIKEALNPTNELPVPESEKVSLKRNLRPSTRMAIIRRWCAGMTLANIARVMKIMNLDEVREVINIVHEGKCSRCTWGRVGDVSRIGDVLLCRKCRGKMQIQWKVKPAPKSVVDLPIFSGSTNVVEVEDESYSAMMKKVRDVGNVPIPTPITGDGRSA